MPKKLLLLLALALVLAAGVFVLSQMNRTAVAPIVPMQEETEKTSETADPVPSFEERVQIEVSDMQSVETEMYVSEKNQFSVRMPVGTQVTESDEIDHAITSFSLKASNHEIVIASYKADVSVSDLEAAITLGKIKSYLADGLTQKNQMQCGESASVCFLTQLYTEHRFPLTGLLESVISKDKFPRYYSIGMGKLNAEITPHDLSLFKQFHDSFRLIR